MRKIPQEHSQLSKSRKLYEKTCVEFGRVPTEGILQDHEHCDLLLDLLRYKSTASPSAWCGLSECRDHMPKDQKTIY